MIKNKDIHGVEYELKNKEQKYYLIKKFDNMSIFISEEHLLNTLLSDYIDNIKSGSLYDHGYPESRLIPSDHHEKCQEYFIEEIIETISEKINNIVEQYF